MSIETYNAAVARHRAGHAGRLQAAQAQVDENMRLHEQREARYRARQELVYKLADLGCVVHDENCCESAHVVAGCGSANVDFDGFEFKDDAEMVALETIRRLLSEDNDQV